MKRKNLVSFGVLLTGLAIFFLALHAKGAFAQNMTFEEMLNIPLGRQDTLAQTSNDLLTPTAIVISDETPNPLNQGSDGYVSQEQVTINEAVLESAKILIEKANETYRTPGWWHSVYQIYYIPPDPESNNLPNGLPMPTEWKEDHWDLVDEKGYVVESVSIQGTGSPETAQIGIYKDGTLTNLTFGMTWKEEPHLVTIGGSPLDTTGMDINMIVLESKDEMLSDEPVAVYTRTTTGTPVTILGGRLVDPGKVENPIIGSYSKSYISKETGLPLLYEVYNTLADGQSQLAHRIATLVYEKVSEPPIDVLKYLQ